MPASPEVRRTRATLATRTAAANRAPDDPAAAAAVDEARREFRASSLEDHIRSVVDGFPPLTVEQRDRLAALLRPAPRGGGAA